MKSLIQKFKLKVLPGSLGNRQSDLNDFVNTNNYNSLHYKNKNKNKKKDEKLEVKEQSNKSDYYYYYYHSEQQQQQQQNEVTVPTTTVIDGSIKEEETTNKKGRGRSSTISIFKSKKEKKTRSNSVFNTPDTSKIINNSNGKEIITTTSAANTSTTTKKILIYDNYMCIFPSTVISIILSHYFKYYETISHCDFKTIYQSIQNIGLVCKEWHYNILPRVELPSMIMIQDDKSMDKYYELINGRGLRFKKFQFSHNDCRSSTLGNLLNDLIDNRFGTKLDMTKYTLPPPPWSSKLMEISKTILDNSITIQFSDHVTDYKRFFELNIGQIINATGTKQIADKITLKGASNSESVQFLLDTYDNFKELTLCPSYSRVNDKTFTQCSFKSITLTHLYIQVRLDQNSFISILQDCTQIQTLHLLQTGVEPFVEQLTNHPTISQLKITSDDGFFPDFVLQLGTYLNNNQIIKSIYLQQLHNQHNHHQQHIYFKKSPFIENCTLKSLSMHFGKNEKSLADQILESWKSPSGIENLECEYYFNPSTILLNHKNIKNLLFKDFNFNIHYDQDGVDNIKIINVDEIEIFIDDNSSSKSSNDGNSQQQQKEIINSKELILIPQLSNLIELNINDQIFNINDSFDDLLANEFFDGTPDLLYLTMDWDISNLKLLNLLPEKLLNLTLNGYCSSFNHSDCCNAISVNEIMDIVSRYTYLTEINLNGFDINTTSSDDVDVEKFSKFLLNSNITLLNCNYSDKQFENKLFKLLV